MNLTNEEYEYLAGQARKTKAAEARAAELEAQLEGAASVVVTLTMERDKATDMAAELLRRLEDAQVHTGKLEAERDAAQLELQQIRTMLDDGTSGNDNSALALVKRLKERCDAARRDAWIDRM